MNRLSDQPWKILIVDDDEDTHDVTEMALRRLIYENRPLMILHAFSALEAKLRLIDHPDIAIALLDVVMENDTAGLDLVKTIREDMNNENIRLILRTGNPGKAPEESVTLTYDINDYRGKTELTAQSLRTAIITALRSYQAVVTIKDLHKEIDDTQKELIYTLGEIAESRSLETGHHVKRVSMISAFLAEKLKLPEHQVNLIGLAASMHDLGKLAIDDRILNKPGKLTPEEFEIVKKHCALGYEILKNSQRELLQLASVIAYEHHENFDGSGYPRGLKGDEISLESQIVALVDVYDALSIKRVYKESWPKDEILEYLRSQIGIKFDPTILNVFFDSLDEIEAAISRNGLWN
jgi:response regulator RpfG family c-di-GMP phosphodiesterase